MCVCFCHVSKTEVSVHSYFHFSLHFHVCGELLGAARRILRAGQAHQPGWTGPRRRTGRTADLVLLLRMQIRLVFDALVPAAAADVAAAGDRIAAVLVFIGRNRGLSQIITSLGTCLMELRWNYGKAFNGLDE